MTHSVYQVEVQDWITIRGRNVLNELNSTSARITVLEGASASLPSQVDLGPLTGRVATLESASAAYVQVGTTNALAARVAALEGASAAYPHQQAVISPKAAIVLLSTLLGRVDQITDALVASGQMRYQ